MRPGTRLAIILASIILFWGVVGYLVFRGDNPKKRAVEVAELALKASVDNPKSVRIIGISQPDSVFGKEYITMDEKMSISMAMMKINEKVMKLTDGLENFNPDDKEIAGLMERQMEAMSVLRSITPQANDNITKSFTGWKVKIEYEGKDSDGKPYHSEYWFILDKEAQCVTKSFEIPLMQFVFFHISYVSPRHPGTVRFNGVGDFCACYPHSVIRAPGSIFRYKVTEGGADSKCRFPCLHGKRTAAFRNLCQIGYSVPFRLPHLPYAPCSLRVGGIVKTTPGARSQKASNKREKIRTYGYHT